jgi:hypothetical protein
MGGPPVYQRGLFELSIDPSQNSLDNFFKLLNFVSSSHFDEMLAQTFFPLLFHGNKFLFYHFI